MTRFEPSGPLRGELRPPPDKSISHRAAILGAMGEGRTAVTNYLDAADTRSTLHAVRAVGAGLEIGAEADGRVDFEIQGVGLRGAQPARIDVGNAGTLMRLLPGWLSGQPRGRWTLDGDESIRRRPVDRIATPLRLMGASVTCRDGRLPPLELEARTPLEGIEYELPVASAQVKSCLLLAGLLGDGPTEVFEPAPSRDHTERMLAAAGAEIVNAANSVAVFPAESISSGPIEVPADFSSAAFFLVAALIVPGSDLRLTEVGVNDTRIGLLDIALRMGAVVELDHETEEGDRDEPTADLIVRAAELNGTEVGSHEVALAIDELPLVALLACFAEGETRVTGADELRHKESDRIATVVEGLRGLGAKIDALEDGFVIEGAGALPGGTIDSHGDHRLAMLGAVAGLASQSGVDVVGMEAAAVSYPGFERDLRSLIP